MKNCPEKLKQSLGSAVEELLVECVGDNVVGSFQQRKSDEEHDVSVFTLVQRTSARNMLLN